MTKVLIMLLLLFSVATMAQPTISLYANVGASGNSTSVSSASVSVTAGDYIILIVHGRKTGGTADIPTVSGFNVTTWEQLTTTTYDNGSGSLRRATAWVGIAGSSSSTTVTATWGVSHNQRYLSAFKITGVNPLTALGAISKVVTSGGNGSNPTISTGARRYNSSAMAVFYVTQSSGTMTIDADFSTLIANLGPVSSFSQPLGIVYAKQEGGNDNSPSVTLSSSYDWTGFAIEFKNGRRIISSN